ncbi:heat shock protein SSB [Diplocarpon rosae]|nr:heat shock protein SSB [Diplocarpon rosae]
MERSLRRVSTLMRLLLTVPLSKPVFFLEKPHPLIPPISCFWMLFLSLSELPWRVTSSLLLFLVAKPFLQLRSRTFTTISDGQQTVQFPVFQGERVNCEDNTSLGEFTLAPIPPMKAGEAVLEVVFEVDVNGILKVTATEKTSGRSANITISNSVGKLSSGEIESMINDAEKFKNSDEAFSKKFEARQQLESYISRVEEIVSDPTMSLKLKRGTKDKIESALSDAMAQLEIEDSTSDDLKKKELALKRVVTKAMSTR